MNTKTEPLAGFGLFYFRKMSLTPPTYEPTSINAGDTVVFTKELSDYPVSDGWTMAYKIVGLNAAPISATVTTSGNVYTVTFAATGTDDLVKGTYQLVGTMTKAGVRNEIYRRTLIVNTDLAAKSVVTDVRTEEEVALDSVKAAIQSYAVRPVDEITIAGRTLRRPTMESLIKVRNQLQKIVNDQRRAEDIKNGIKPQQTLGTFNTYM